MTCSSPQCGEVECVSGLAGSFRNVLVFCFTESWFRTVSAHLQRAQLLQSQSRYQQAVDEYRQHLLDEPDDAFAHANLGLCLLQLEQYDASQQHAEQAIGIDPEDPYGFYALSVILGERGHVEPALQAIAAALRMAPDVAHFYYWRGTLHMSQSDWTAALADAEQGLALEPENVNCENLRARALVMLGRKVDAGTSLRTALEHDPDNPHTHANLGWSLLEQGDTQQAMFHFREALRLNPNNEWARRGIVSGLKSRNIIYRLCLKYFFAMAKLKGQTAMMIIIGGYLLFRYVGSLNAEHPEWSIVLTPLLYTYIGFVLLTWLADPLFNLLLLLNRDGRLALTTDEHRGATLLGSGLLITLLLGGLTLWTGNELVQEAAIRMLVFQIPLSGVFRTESGKSRWRFSLIVAALFGVGAFGISPAVVWWDGEAYVAGENFVSLSRVFYYGVLASQFLLNSMAMRPRRH